MALIRNRPLSVKCLKSPLFRTQLSEFKISFDLERQLAPTFGNNLCRVDSDWTSRGGFHRLSASLPLTVTDVPLHAPLPLSRIFQRPLDHCSARMHGIVKC